jgi:hypothetical protein
MRPGPFVTGVTTVAITIGPLLSGYHPQEANEVHNDVPDRAPVPQRVTATFVNTTTSEAGLIRALPSPRFDSNR